MADYQDTTFWSERIIDSNNPQAGPGYPDLGFNKIDPYHRDIISILIKPNDNVLDAGCGVGRISGWFKRYTGIDFVSEFIEIAEKLHPDKFFVVADFNEKLPFKNKKFDWAISISSYQYYKSKELERVSKKILVLNYTDPKEYQIYE